MSPHYSIRGRIYQDALSEKEVLVSNSCSPSLIDFGPSNRLPSETANRHFVRLCPSPPCAQEGFEGSSRVPYSELARITRYSQPIPRSRPTNKETNSNCSPLYSQKNFPTVKENKSDGTTNTRSTSSSRQRTLMHPSLSRNPPAVLTPRILPEAFPSLHSPASQTYVCNNHAATDRLLPDHHALASEIINVAIILA